MIDIDKKFEGAARSVAEQVAQKIEGWLPRIAQEISLHPFEFVGLGSSLGHKLGTKPLEYISVVLYADEDGKVQVNFRPKFLFQEYMLEDRIKEHSSEFEIIQKAAQKSKSDDGHKNALKEAQHFNLLFYQIRQSALGQMHGLLMAHKKEYKEVRPPSRGTICDLAGLATAINSTIQKLDDKITDIDELNRSIT